MDENDESIGREVVEAVRRFVDRDVIPVASELEHNDEYPHALVARMKELGLFGATIPGAIRRPGPELRQLRAHHGRTVARMDVPGGRNQ